MAIFFLVSALVLGVEIFRNRSFFNMSLWISGPYILIVFLNNLFLKNWGYRPVSDPVLQKYAGLILLIFAGGVLCDLLLPKSSEKHLLRSEKFSFSPDKRCLKWMKIYLCFIIAVRLVDVVATILRIGVQNIVDVQFEALNMSGIPGHLMLSGYVLLPYLFDAWLSKKGWSNFWVLFGFAGVSFLSLVKYQTIILLVMLFVFYCFKYPKKVPLAFGLMVSCAIGIFLLSYFVSFIMENALDKGLRSYWVPLWTYISGGTLMGDSLAMEGVGLPFVSDWLVTHFEAPINLIRAFIGAELHPLPAVEYHTIGLLAPAGNLLHTNVCSELAYLSLLSSPWIAGALAFVSGFVNQLYFRIGQKTRNESLRVVACFLLSANFLGFFSNYYSLSAIWEILAFCLILIPLLTKSRDFHLRIFAGKKVKK